jgi:hypothetical protein
MVMLEMIIVNLIMCSTTCKQQNKQLVNHCHSKFFVIQVFYNYNVVVNSKHKLHDIDVQFVHFDFEGKVFIPCFLSFVFYIVAWKLLELLESSFAILLCSLLMHETFGIGCVVHCCILCLWSILIHLTIQFDLEMTMLIKPTLFENFHISSKVRVTLDKGPMKSSILIGQKI